MSADNGIYIGVFPDKNAPFGDTEYRVIHAQAIENLEYNPNTDDGFNAVWVCLLYAEAPRFISRQAAFEHAEKMEKEILSDDFCPILEYGISFIERFEHPFEWYVKQVVKKIAFGESDDVE